MASSRFGRPRRSLPPPAPGTVGQRVQDVRFRLSPPGMRLTLEQFAKMIAPPNGEPPSASTIQRWEHNEYEPSISYLIEIARHDPLERGVCWLLTGEGCQPWHPHGPTSYGAAPVEDGPRRRKGGGRSR